LLAVGVGVVTAGVDARLYNRLAVDSERSDGVADDLGAAEQLGERVDRVLHLADLVVGGLDPRDVVKRFLDPLGVAAGGDERQVVLPQVLGHEPAGVPAHPVDDDGLGRAH
jgi:hypothetical protein